MLYIKGIARGFGDGDSIIHGKAGGYGADADNYAPRSICSNTAVGIAGPIGANAVVGALKNDGRDESGHSRHQLAKTLHGEDGCYEAATPSSRGKSKPR